MKKAILFYTRKSDEKIDRDLPNLKDYLKKKGFEFEISIIAKDPLLAHKYNVMVSPILIIIEKNNEIKRLVGISKDVLNHLKGDY